MSSIKGHRFHPFEQSQSTQTSGVSLAASSQTSDLSSSPLLEYLGYRFNKKHSVMICVPCGCAVFPTHALTHVKSQHSISVSREQQELWDLTVLQWNVTTETHIPFPTNRQPVELLKIHPNAYCCNCCDYAALTIATFSKHWSMTHRTSDLRPIERYHRGSVQTFYSHAPCIYFEIDIPIPNSTSLFDAYMKKEVPNYIPFDVTIPSAPREIPPLLYSTRWHEHLSNYITDKKKRRILFTIAHPTKFAKERLWKLVWNYLDFVVDIFKDTSMRVKCLLTEYPM
jgi:hypothetical protein